MGKRGYPFSVGSVQVEIEGSPACPGTIYYPAVEAGADAEPDERRKPYPAVVFAEGFAPVQGFTRIMRTWLCKHTASHGYVVAAFESASLNPLRALEKKEQAITRYVDYLTSQSSSSHVKGVVDENKMGVAGHSMGGMTVLGVAARDKRIQAVVSMAPFYNEFLWAIGGTSLPDYIESCRNIQAPTQIICGEMDFLCPASKTISYYNALTVTKEFLVVNRASHDLGLLDVPLPMTMGPREPGRSLTTKYMINWFNRFLYGHRDADPYLFGTEAHEDLKAGLLTELKYEQ